MVSQHGTVAAAGEVGVLSIVGTTLTDEIASAAWSVAIAIGPLATLFLIFQIFLLKLPRGQIAEVLAGTVIATAGLFLFLLGVEIGFLPFGREIGAALGTSKETWFFVAAGLVLGFLTTWGEPAVRVLADQIEEASNGSIPKPMVLHAICAGVAIWVGLGVLRLIFGIPLLYLLMPGYILVIGLTWLSDRSFLAIAVDAGGVATGPLANSFLLSLALGASSAMGYENPIADGFGFVALIALAPIISVMVLGLFIRPRTREKE